MQDEPQPAGYYFTPHEDITAAYYALSALDMIDSKIYGRKDIADNIRRNALIVIDKNMQYLADSLETSEEATDE